MLTLHYQPEKDDYARAYRAFYRDSWKTRIPLFIIILIPIIYLWVVAPPHTFITSAALLLPILILVYLIVFTFMIHPNQSAKQLMGNDLMNGPSTIEINDERIRVVSKLNESIMEWSAFTRVIETDELFILIFTTNMSILRIVPKRIFSSDEDMQYFKTLVEEKISRNPDAIEMVQKQKQESRKRIVITLLWVIVVVLGIIMFSVPKH